MRLGSGWEEGWLARTGEGCVMCRELLTSGRRESEVLPAARPAATGSLPARLCRKNARDAPRGCTPDRLRPTPFLYLITCLAG